MRPNQQNPEIASYLQINRVGKVLEYQTRMGALRPRAISPLQQTPTYGETMAYVAQRLDELKRINPKVPTEDAVHYPFWQSIQSIVKAYTGNTPENYETVREVFEKIAKDFEKQDALLLQVGKEVGFVIEREENCVGF